MLYRCMQILKIFKFWTEYFLHFHSITSFELICTVIEAGGEGGGDTRLNRAMIRA